MSVRKLSLIGRMRRMSCDQTSVEKADADNLNVLLSNNEGEGSLQNNEESNTIYDLQSIGRFKVVVIGDDDCGKTSMLNSFVKKTYADDMTCLFEDGVSTFRFGAKQVDFLIFDLSGCENYDGFRPQFYDDADIFIVCFDIGNVNSLENVKETWIPEVYTEEPEAPYILVGCKHDLRTEPSLRTHLTIPGDEYGNETSVSRIMGEQVALEWGAKEYIECCAKTGFNITEVFRTAAQILVSGDDKNSSSTFKGLSRFARRKSAELGERLHGKSSLLFVPSHGSRRSSAYT